MMFIKPYKGVDSILPGKHIVLLCGQYADNVVTPSGELKNDSFSNHVISKSNLGTDVLMRVQSSQADRRRHRINVTFADDSGNRQRLAFDLKMCGKGTVFGHHHKLTVELREFPNKKGPGKAVSDITGENVPFKGALSKNSLPGLLYDWIDELFNELDVFFDPESVLDALRKEHALECFVHKNLELAKRIPLCWNPGNVLKGLPKDL